MSLRSELPTREEWARQVVRYAAFILGTTGWFPDGAIDAALADPFWSPIIHVAADYSLSLAVETWWICRGAIKARLRKWGWIQ